MNQVAEAEVEVKNANGLHIGPAGEVVKTAISFLSKITIRRGTDVANAHSMVALTTLGAGIGTRLIIRAEGPDAEAAVKAIAELFNRKFGED
jgi:phosphotransferase system HPr (HPr) family protein